MKGIPGPRPADAADDPRLEAWERRMNPVVIAAAIVPIVVGLTEEGQAHPAVWLDLVSWLVFVADFVVHLLWKRRYLRSRLGWFDLAIVVLTAPWYVIPGLGNARVLGLARLGRLARVFVVSSKSRVLRQLGRRLGRAAIYSLVLMACCAFVVEAVEPASSGFDSFGTSMWWAVVTFTTVGYGDLVPVTFAGRVAAILLMVGGIALIGTLAGSLGTFFARERTDPDGAVTDTVDVIAEDLAATDGRPGLEFEERVLAELTALRAEVAELRARTDPR